MTSDWVDDDDVDLAEVTLRLSRLRAARVARESSGWVSMRPVVTRRFLELDDPERYMGPSVLVGVAWYDRPNGTIDLERATHER